MARKNVIKVEFDSPFTVLGIASNEKIWKVAWGINQALGLELTSRQEESNVNMEVLDLYTDYESNIDFDFLLFENTQPTRKVPPLARKFRFWLVIRQKRETTPEISKLLEQLGAVDLVTFAVDLTQEKDIKKLLP